MIHTWSIPAVTTCPGATEACLSVCYAKSGHAAWPSTQFRWSQNYEFSQTELFEQWLASALISESVRTLRVHVAGDIYSAEYAAKLRRVFQKNRRVVAYLYTRSWREAAIVPELRALAKLKNVHLWLSADADTGRPVRISRTRIAWMARNDTEALAVPEWANLIFRNTTRTTLKKVNGIQVCPAEIGVPDKPKITCSRCQICFREAK